MGAIEIFEFVRDIDCFPNISIPYCILFTVPVIAQHQHTVELF